MEYEINSQLIEKAKECKSADDLLTLAKDNGIALTEAEAMNLFARLNSTSGELSDDTLEAVSGGYNVFQPNKRENEATLLPIR